MEMNFTLQKFMVPSRHSLFSHSKACSRLEVNSTFMRIYVHGLEAADRVVTVPYNRYAVLPYAVAYV